MRVTLLALILLLATSAHADADDAAAGDGTNAPQTSATKLERLPGPETEGFDTANAKLIARGLANLGALRGKPVRAVSVETMGTRWRESPTVSSVEIGQPLTAAMARGAIRELLETGRFAQAYADARPYEDGAIMRIVVMPRRIVAGIEIIGGVLDQRRTLSAMEIDEGDEITEPMLRTVATNLRTYHKRYGYDRAAVRIDVSDTDDPMEILLDIEIDPGEQRSISRRIFVIEPKYDRVLGTLKHDYEVETGDPIDEDALLEADNEMAELLRSAGFIDAIVKHRVLRSGEHAFLYIYLDTGPRYRFHIEGNRRQDVDDLLAALELDEPAADASPPALADRLRNYYRRRGFYDARVKVRAEPSADGALVNVRFRIHEGAPMRVTRRLFPCLPAKPPEGLSANDLGEEIDAVLEDELPSMPLLHEVNELAVDGIFASSGGGTRAEARRLEPAMTYTPEAYERAIKHLRELLHSKGYLNAKVGPVSIMRAECNPNARGGRCEPLPLPMDRYRAPTCGRDALDIPIPESPIDEQLTCNPDPTRSLHCAPTMTVHIPVQLGPQMQLYDIVFEGNKILTPKELLEIVDYPLGEPYSAIELDAAQARLVGAYQDRGYAYASVRVSVDYSPDRTRARARFIINEHRPVIIEEYEVRGAVRTEPSLIINRLALCQQPQQCAGEERYFKRTLVRESEEQIATLGTFRSVSIALEDPHIPQQRKRVIITVVELAPQYFEPSGGFFTGDGFRAGVEWGHRNIGGQAIALTIRLEFAYLPDFLILDEDVRDTYENLNFGVSERLERRNTGSLRFPDVGLGPKIDVVINGVDARDNQRDFGLTREAVFPTLNYRPIRQVTLQLGTTAELNDVTLFNAESLGDAIKANPALEKLLRVPEGRTIAFAQRVAFSWDRRNKPLAATSGTLFTSAVEHVSALPLDEETEISSEFLKLTTRGAGYIPLGDGGMAFAMSLAAGYNLQLTADSETYPDRLFYLGGVNTVRGFELDSVVPVDLADRVRNGEILIEDVVVRGGDLYVNPRVELRIPLTAELSSGVFVDGGNVWSNASSMSSFTDLLDLRYTAGAGLRLETPVGPIALDYGFKLVRHEWEDLGALHFSIGLF